MIFFPDRRKTNPAYISLIKIIKEGGKMKRVKEEQWRQLQMRSFAKQRLFTFFKCNRA